MKKKILLIIICYIILILIVSLLILFFYKNKSKDLNKLQVIATLYPEYDFISKIGGDKVEVTLLLDAGVEAHTYEPSVRDMKEISGSDMFIYTGKAMEPWAETVISSINTECSIVDVSKNIELIELDDFISKYSILDEEEHEHNEAEHSYEYDGHIWMDPKNAIIMLDTICDELVKLDPKNKDYYEKNANEYKLQMNKLDKEIEEALRENNIDTLVVGGELDRKSVV